MLSDEEIIQIMKPSDENDARDECEYMHCSDAQDVPVTLRSLYSALASLKGGQNKIMTLIKTLLIQ